MRKLTNEELNRKTQDEFHSAEKLPVVFVLENIRSMNNVGSVFRSADAFLLEAIYLCGITPVPPHREIQKTALGATETVSWKHFADTAACIAALRETGYRIYAVEQAENSMRLENLPFTGREKTALIFGNEVEGVEQKTVDACDGVTEIDQQGTKHSLNIAVSAGIVAWEMHRKSKN